MLYFLSDRARIIAEIRETKLNYYKVGTVNPRYQYIARVFYNVVLHEREKAGGHEPPLISLP